MSNYPADEGEHEDILDAFERRLEDTSNSCDIFSEALRRADGGPAARPWAGGGDPPNTTYVQRCDSGRIGVVILTDSTQRRVKGYAMVYITGCFDKDSGFSSSENECGGSHDDEDEVRGAIIRGYVPETDLGGVLRPMPWPMTAAHPNTIITTQTVE
jgi:hypothetical protein